MTPIAYSGQQRAGRQATRVKIMLVGGPADGEVFSWAGGDVVTLELMPPLRLVLDPDAPPTRPARQEAWYRRSLRNPDVFVFQP